MHSLLFVPSKTKMLLKIESFNSDAYILDLEDSISPDQKEDALFDLTNYLKDCQRDDIYIRLDLNYIEHQLIALKEYNFKGYMLPKFENLMDFENYLAYFEGKEIIALVETPLGVANIEEIAKAPWVDAIAFGAEDFTASMSMLNEEKYINPYRSKLVLYSKAYNKCVYDTPSFTLYNQEKFEAEIDTAVEMGFDGKLAINPKQLDAINMKFSAFDFDFIRYVVEEFEKSEDAVVKIDGKIYEKMHINHLKKILKENS